MARHRSLVRRVTLAALLALAGGWAALPASSQSPAPALADPQLPLNPLSGGLIPLFRIVVKAADTVTVPASLAEIEKLPPQRASLTATLELVRPLYLTAQNDMTLQAGTHAELAMEEDVPHQAPAGTVEKRPVVVDEISVNGLPLADEEKGERILDLWVRVLWNNGYAWLDSDTGEVEAFLRPLREGEYPDHPEYTHVLEYIRRVESLAHPVKVELRAIVSPHHPANPIELETQPDPDAGVGHYLAYPPRPIGPGIYQLRVTAKTEGYGLGQTFNEQTHRYEPVKVTVLPADADPGNFDDKQFYGTLVQVKPRPITGASSAKNFLEGALYYEDPRGRRRPLPNGTDVTVYSIMSGPSWTNSVIISAEFFNGTTRTVGNDGYFGAPLGWAPPTLGRRNRIGVLSILYDQNPKVPGIKAAVVPPTDHTKPYQLVTPLFNVDEGSTRYVVNEETLPGDPRTLVVPSAEKLTSSAGGKPVWEEGTLVEDKFQGALTTDSYVASAEAKIMGEGPAAALAFTTIIGGFSLFGAGTTGMAVGGASVVAGTAFAVEMTHAWAELSWHSTSNVLLFHNHTAALSVLTPLGRGYDFVKSVAVMDPNVFGIDVPSPLPGEQRQIIPALVAQYHPFYLGDANAGQRTNYDNAPGGRRCLKVHALDFDNDELLLQMYGRFIHDVFIYPVPYNLKGLSEEQKAWARGWEIFFSAAVRHDPIVHLGLETAVPGETATLPTADLRYQSTIEGSKGIRSDLAVATVLWKLYNFNWDKDLVTRAAPEPLGPYSFQNNIWGTIWQAVTGLRKRGLKAFPTIVDFWKVFREIVDPTAGNTLAQGDKTYLLGVLGQLWDVMLEAGMLPREKVVKGLANVRSRQGDLGDELEVFVSGLNDMLPSAEGVTFDLAAAPTDTFEPGSTITLSGVSLDAEGQAVLNLYQVQQLTRLQQLLSSMMESLHTLRMGAIQHLGGSGGDGRVAAPVFCKVTAHLPNGQQIEGPVLQMKLVADQQRLLETATTVVKLEHDFKMAVTRNLRSRASVTRQAGEESIAIPPGALPGVEFASTQPVGIGFSAPDFEVVGGAAWMIAPADRPLAAPATLTLAYAGADLGDADPAALAIFRWDPELQNWLYVGGTVNPDTQTVSVQVDRLGVFVLALEKAPPLVTEVGDAPDPISPTSEGTSARAPGDTVTTISFAVSKPGRVTVKILDSSGAAVATLMDRVLLLRRSGSVTWDGTDAAGQPVPHGTYHYQIVAEDFAGHLSSPVEGVVTVNRLAPGIIAGMVADPQGIPLEGVRAAVRGMTLAAISDAEGAFSLMEVPAGTLGLDLSRAGYFPEQVEGVVVTAGQTFQLPPATLTNQITRDLSVLPVRFNPEREQGAESVLVSYVLQRNAAVTVTVRDENGALVRTLVGRQEQLAGRNVASWTGDDQAGGPAPSGVYWVHVQAEAGGIAIEQGRAKAVLDRGLIRSIGVSAASFAPGTEAIDTTTSVAYDLDAPALISTTVLTEDGTLVRQLSNQVLHSAGVGRETWDGRDDRGEVVPDGRYLLRVTPAFPDGTASDAKSVQVVISTFKPVLTELRPTNGSVVATGLPTVTCYVNRPQEVDPAGLKVQLDGAVTEVTEFDPTSGLIRFTPLTSIGPGEHVVVVYARSKAGVQATPLSNAFTVQLEDEDEVVPEVRDLKPVNRPAPDFEQVYTRTPALEGRLFDAATGVDKDSIILTIDGTTQILGVEEVIPGSSGVSWDRWHYVRAILFYNPLSGEFRYNPLTPLSNDALHFFTIEATDRAGNKVQGQTTFKVLLDEQAPVVTALSPADGEAIAQNPPTVTATLSDGEGSVSGIDAGTLRLLIDGEAVERPWAYYQPETGGLTYAVPAPLTENAQHIVTVDVKDQAGNPAAQARSVFHLKTDSQPPGVFDLAPGDGTRTDDKRPIIRARLVDRGDSQIDPAAIVLKVDGAQVAAEYNAETHQVSYQPAEDLTLGQHLVTLDVADTSRNRAAQAISVFEVAADITPPVIEELAPAYGSITQEARPEISAVLKDSGLGIDPESIVLKLDGQPVALPEGAYQAATGRLTYRPAQPFAERTQHIAVIEAQDLGGNPATPATTLFAIKGFSGGAVGGTLTLEGRQDAGGAVVRLEGTELQATTDAAGQFALPSVPEGAYTLVVEKRGFLPARQRYLRVTVGALVNVGLTLTAGDSNEDGRINLADWAVLLGALGSQTGDDRYTDAADYNLDGKVDETDAALLERNFGKYQP